MLLKDWCNKNKCMGDIIKSEWTGIDNQGNKIDFNCITHGSGVRMIWKCTICGHTWDAPIGRRTSVHSRCPQCIKNEASHRVSTSKLKTSVNDLDTWCNQNGEWGNIIREQYTGLMANGEKINIDKVVYGSNKRMIWECERGHRWESVIRARTLLKSRCPYCVGTYIVDGENDLYTWCINNKHEYLIEQFTELDENNNKIDIKKIHYASHKKLWWKHNINNIEHKWIATVKHRTLCNSMCPICNGKKILSGYNDLETWCNNNIIIGNILKEQFGNEDILGNKIKINEIAPKSYKKILWKHQTVTGELHKWYSTVYNRTTHYSMCPFCSNKGTSLPEQIIYRCFKQIYPNTISRGKYQGYEFDITIPELRTCIEYDNTYYHNGREDRDREKEKLCKQYNVNFIRVIHDSTNRCNNEIYSKTLIVTKDDSIYNIEQTIKYLLSELHVGKMINYDKAVEDSLNFMLNKTLE